MASAEPEPATSRPFYQYIVAATALIAAITGLVGLFIHNANSGSGSSSAPAADKSSSALAATPSASSTIPTPVIVGSTKTDYGWVLKGRLDPSSRELVDLDVVVLAKDRASGSKYVSDTATVIGDTWIAAISLPSTVTDVDFVPGTIAHRALPAFTGPSDPMPVAVDPSFQTKGASYHP